MVRSPRCISLLKSGYSRFPVGLSDNATWVKVVKSSCSASPAQLVLLYKDKAIDYQSYLENCVTTTVRVGKTYANFNKFARDSEAKLMLSVFDRVDFKEAIPGFGTNVIAESMGGSSPVLFLECQYIAGLDPGYVLNDIFNNRSEVHLDFSLDPNSYLAVFDSPVYQAVISIFGVIYLLSGVLAGYFLYKRLTDKRFVKARIPQLLLAIELVVLSFLGVHLVGGRWASNPEYPTDLHLALFQLLYGASLGTSVLAGVFYEDVYLQSVKFKPDSMNTFWKRHSGSLLVVAILCLGLDVGSTLASVFFVDNIGVILGTVNVLALLVLGIVFIRKTSRFVLGARSMLDVRADEAKEIESGSYTSSKSKRFDVVSRWLFLSAVSMLLTIVVYGVLGISGTLIAGAYEPVAYAVTWVFYIVLRWLPSFSQIMLTNPVPVRRSSKSARGATRMDLDSSRTDIQKREVSLDELDDMPTT